MEFSLDADSPINTPVLPCTPDFYLSRCKQVKYFSSPGQLSIFAVTYSVMFYLWAFEKYLLSHPYLDMRQYRALYAQRGIYVSLFYL